MKEEVWKDIKEYEGLYQVSNQGQIRSLEKWYGNSPREAKLLKQCISTRGYFRVGLRKSTNKKRMVSVARLVAFAFVQNINNKPQVNHKDGNKANNSSANLEWCTMRENNIHALRNKLRIMPNGEDCSFSQISNLQARAIKDYILTNPSLKPTAIARTFKVSRNIVRSIQEERAWAHL